MTPAAAARGGGRRRKPGVEAAAREGEPMNGAVVEPLIRTVAAADTRVWMVHGQDTLPKLFRHVVTQRGDKVAMREKDLGIWRSVSWREYGEKARHVGLGLVPLGLKPGD